MGGAEIEGLEGGEVKKEKAGVDPMMLAMAAALAKQQLKGGSGASPCEGPPAGDEEKPKQGVVMVISAGKKPKKGGK